MRQLFKCKKCGCKQNPGVLDAFKLGKNWTNLKILQEQLGYAADYIHVGGRYPTKIEKTRKDKINISDKGYVICPDCTNLEEMEAYYE